MEGKHIDAAIPGRYAQSRKGTREPSLPPGGDNFVLGEVDSSFEMRCGWGSQRDPEPDAARAVILCDLQGGAGGDSPAGGGAAGGE